MLLQPFPKFTEIDKKKQISHFTRENDTGEKNDAILWTSLKVVIRGHTLGVLSHKRLKKKSKQWIKGNLM